MTTPSPTDPPTEASADADDKAGSSSAASADVRARGRELVLGLLCHLEDVEPQERSGALSMLLKSPPTGDEADETRFSDLVAETRVRKFAEKMVADLLDVWLDVDEAITAVSRRWRIERMDRVDRNALRIAGFELLARDKTPRGVVLSEAVRLASTYGNERSASFVNGLAASLADRLRPREPR